MDRLKTRVTDVEDALLVWIQENHGGRDETRTIEVLSGFGPEQFKQALQGLQEKGIVTIEGPEVEVTAPGLNVWERLHGAQFRESQAAQYLRKLLDGQINALVCGGNRSGRRRVIRHGALDAYLKGSLQEIRPRPRVDQVLEHIAPKPAVIAVLDAHLISTHDMWAIRSVVQSQRDVTYIFEGANHTKMLDMVVDYNAAFYRQLTVVDLSRTDRGRIRQSAND